MLKHVKTPFFIPSRALDSSAAERSKGLGEAQDGLQVDLNLSRGARGMEDHCRVDDQVDKN